MKLGKVIQLALTLCLGVGTASAQSIDIFADLAGTICQGDFAPGSPTNPTLYIQHRLGGDSAAGITGAEFWVQNFPAGWFAIVTPNPASGVALGSPFATTSPFRANIAFAVCQDVGPLILLYTVTVIPTTVVPSTHLKVVIGNPPSNVDYTSAIVTICDAPLYSAVACAGGEFFINDTVNTCTVGVEDVTWGQVKGLYSN